MLPNRPRRDGLPVTPRSRAAGRSRQDEPSGSYSRGSSSRYGGLTSSRNVRPQQSLASTPSESPQDRSGHPPMSQSQQTYRPYNSLRAYELPSVNRKEYTGSSSSVVSSHTSSLQDRSRGNDNESLRTSLKDDYEPLRSGRGHNSKAKEDPRQLYERHDRERSSAAGRSGAGYTLWSRLATAAGTLSLDVSTAWAVNVTLASGEETPPGRESHLTRAMKAYHLEKARDPSDLPEWLFEEHERRPVGRLCFTGQQKNNYQDGYEAVSESGIPAPRSRGLRDIYNSAAVPTERPNGGIASRFNDQSTTPSKATDRLKALRDAKRQNNRFDEDPPFNNTTRSDRPDVQGADILDKRPPPRIGLPGPPRGRAQRY